MIKMYKSLRLLLVILLGVNLGTSAQTTFTTPGGPYPYVVPTGVTGITVTLKGAVGGLSSDNADYPDRWGYGSCVQAVITVTPGQVLQVYVGGRGGNGTDLSGGTGGINGGGNGSNGFVGFSGGGGGGASDIRLTVAESDRLVVAAGGGGAGIDCGADADRGGDGGTLTGENGVGCGAATGGGGGTGIGGGAGGVCGTCSGSAGSPGVGGTGGDGGVGSAGGGGGGGYYGAGGGQWTGGGGGSDYVSGPGVYTLSDTRGCNTSGNGSVSISVTCTAGLITGPSTVCVGSTVTLNDPISGGTWISSDVTKATVSPTGDVTGIAAGPVVISYELSPGVPGCRAVFNMTVNPVPAAIVSPSGFLCVGSTLTLTDASSGGLWSATNGNATIDGTTGVVTGVVAGVDTFYYSYPTGCRSSTSIVINPVPSPISGPTSVCEGSSITLTDPTIGGTWSSVPLSGGFATVGFTTGVVGGVTAGTVTISYTVGACAATYIVTINPLPATIAGPATVCMGSTIKDTSVTLGGTYTSSVVTVATVDPVTGVITPVSPGITVITYTLPTGCVRTRTITVNPLPLPITGLSEVCEGSTIVLTSPSGSGTWTSGSTGIATVTAGPATTTTVTGVGVAGGVADITFSLTSTGCKVSKSVTVDPRPTVITGTDPVCTGTTTTMSSGPSGGTWTSGTTAVGTIDATTGDFTALTVGTSTIRYQLSTGCFRTRVMTVNLTPVPITGPTSVCQGQSITLNDATAGGTWSSPDDPTLVSVTGAGTSATVFGNGVGVANISYSMATGCRATYLVTVNPIPSAIVGTTGSICANDSTQLTDPTSGGTWSSSLTAVATVGSSTGMVYGVSGGVVTITYTLPTGCYVTYSLTIISLPSVISPPYSVCANASPFTLTSGGGAGDWSSSNTAVATINTVTGDVTVVGAGVTTICYTFTSGAGCARCEQLTVNPIPNPISGPGTVCTGATITLTDGTGGGTWTATNGRATVGALSGIVTGVSAGVDSIVYTLSSGCNVIKVITVNQSPAAITGTLNICQGLTTVLNDATPGGNWTIFPFTVATLTPTSGTTTTVTGVSAGTANIRYTNPANGCYAQATVTVSTLSSPITGPSQVCTGSTILLSESVGGTWSSSNTAIGTVGSTTGIVGGISPGTVDIIFSSLGCQTSKTITVNLTPTAIVTPLGSTNLCPGDVVALTTSTGAGYTYQWRNGFTNIVGQTNSTYVANAAGNYNVIVSTAFCSATSPNLPVTMNPVTAGVFPTTATVCASTPPTLTALPPGMSYQWLESGVPIAGAIGVAYTATASGTYTVKVTNGFGCSSTSPNAVINLIASPAAPITASGPTSFCAGGSVVLSTTGGSGLTYQWLLGGLPIAGATGTSFSASVAGNYTVVITNSIGCSTTSSVVNVAITPGPPATIVPVGTLTFCSGGSVTLAAPGGAYTYVWYNGGVPISGATNSSYTATTSGSYTVKVTSTATGCSTTSSVETATMVPLPIVSPLSSTSICWGSSVTLTATVLSGIGTISYQWSRNGTPIPGATSASYVANATGLYTVGVTVAAGLCTVTSVGTYVTVYPLPNPLVTFDGAYFHTGSFLTYQWAKNLIAIPGATTSSTIALGFGSYTVRVSDIHGCQSVSPAFVLSSYTYSTHTSGSRFDTEETGSVINSVNNGDIKIYPNPTQSMVHIESAFPLRAVVSGMDGRTVIDKQQATDLDMSNLANGVYIIKLYDADGELVKLEKLVKSAN